MNGRQVVVTDFFGIDRRMPTISITKNWQVGGNLFIPVQVYWLHLIQFN
jgi:hypothetical protein